MKMTARIVVGVMVHTIWLLTVSLVPTEVHAEDVRRVGIIGKASFKAFAPRLDSLKQGMREYGYIEGKNVSFEYRFADGNLEVLPDLAAELEELDLDVVVAAGCPAADAAKELADSFPVVVYTTNPVTTGLIKSFARPGGNITGMTLMTGSEFHSKRLELLKMIFRKHQQFLDAILFLFFVFHF